MVAQKTSRLGLEKYSEGSDPHPPRTKFNSEREILDAMVALAVQGVTSARPAAGIVNRLYWDTTAKRLHWDDGAAWNEVTTNGGGGAGGAIIPGAAGVEGVSDRSARADHTHLLALATAVASGAMSATDKAKLDAASATATPGSLVLLDSNGRTQVASPAAPADTANMGYVDTQIGTRAPSTHNHTVSQLSDATPTGETLIKATSTAAARTAIGLGSVDNTADEAKPVSTATASALSGKSSTNHTHSWSSISGKPGTFAPSAHNHPAAQITSGTIHGDRLPYARGTTGVSNVLAGNVHNGYFDFPPGKFTSTPQVFLQSTHSKLTPGIGSITTDRAYFTIANNSDGATGGASILHWLAVQ